MLLKSVLVGRCTPPSPWNKAQIVILLNERSLKPMSLCQRHTAKNFETQGAWKGRLLKNMPNRRKCSIDGVRHKKLVQILRN